MTYTKPNVLTHIFNLFFSAPICASSAQICDTDNTALLQLPEMSEIHITEESVGILLHKLNPHSAHGPIRSTDYSSYALHGLPDGTSNHILKRCPDHIAPFLVVLYRLSLCQGKLPQDWKMDDIAPMHKDGD